jgi:SAM-dependent methyltransferase
MTTRPLQRDYRHSHVDTDAAEYDRPKGVRYSYFHKRHHEILTDLVPELYPGGIDTYLDFACGTGRVTLTVEPFASVSHGVDISRFYVGRRP